MNRSYKVVFNQGLNKYSVVSEIASSNGKVTSRSMTHKVFHGVFALTAIAGALLYPMSNAWATCTVTAGVSAIADNASSCALPAQSFAGTSSTVTGGAVVSAMTGATLNLEGDVSVNATDLYALNANGAGSSLSSTSKVTVVTNSDDDNGVYAVHNGTVKLNDADIQTSGATYAQGMIAYDFGTITVAGQANIVTTGNSTSTQWRANQGVVADAASQITLNNTNITTAGGYGTGILSVNFSDILSNTGTTTINTAGQLADGVAALHGSSIALHGGGTIATTGINAAAVRVLENNIPTDVISTGGKVNNVTLNHFTLSATNANVIEANMGHSTIDLYNTTASAASGHQLLHVDDGSSLTSSGFQTTFGVSNLVANLAFSSTASNLTGDVVVEPDGSTADLSFKNNSTLTGKMSNVTNATFDANSVWNMTDSSTLSKNLNNAGTINFKNVGSTLLVGGNYSGTAGSVIALNTVLGDDASTTDKIHVVGDTAGTTRLAITNVGGAGAQTINGIGVVQVDGNSAAGSFTMAAPVQAGSYEYTLKQGSAVDANDWYLTSKLYSTPNCIDQVGEKCDSNPPVINVYRPGVAAYVAAQTANQDAGFTQLSSLHQRMSEMRQTPNDNAMTWGRMIAANQSNNGRTRFGYDQLTTGFQIGRDLLNGNQQRAGVTLNFAHSDIDARDSVRPVAGLAANTGNIGSNSVGLGGYFTKSHKNGSYLDFVGQVNHVNNHYDDSYGGVSSQNAWQVGASAEVGKSVAMVKGWSVEPQAQLSYLYGKYNGFKDAYSTIASNTTNNLRARLGVRLAKDTTLDGKGAHYYGIVNVAHDFMKPKSIHLTDNVGTNVENIGESFDRSYGEVGAGIQGNFNATTQAYADMRYQRSFNGNKEGAQFNLGVKVKF